MDLNKEAEEYARSITKNIEPNISDVFLKQGYIDGYNSKYVQAKILQAQVDGLNTLDSILQSKVETLNTMLDSTNDNDNKEYFRAKMSGVKLAKEEIRRDLKQLEQQLKQLGNE